MTWTCVSKRPGSSVLPLDVDGLVPVEPGPDRDDALALDGHVCAIGGGAGPVEDPGAGEDGSCHVHRVVGRAVTEWVPDTPMGSRPMTRRSPGPALLLALLLVVLVVLPLRAQGPTSEAALEAGADRVAEIIEGMTLRQKVGQLFASRVYGDRANDPPRLPGGRTDATSASTMRASCCRRYHVGSVVYFEYAGNLERPAAGGPALQRHPAGCARGGHACGPHQHRPGARHHPTAWVRRPRASPEPWPWAPRATADLAREAARVTGEELRAVGIRQNLAPVADVNVNPANPVIGIRSFGSRPGLVADMSAAQVHGFEDDAGVAATAKHFPGHGDTNLDSHTRLPTIRHDEATWWAVDAPPFEAAIEAGVDVIMTAHVAVPALDPSSVRRRCPTPSSPASCVNGWATTAWS